MDSNVSASRKKNPRESASWLSITTLSFVWEIFQTGFQRDIKEEDVYEIVKDFSSEKLGKRLGAEWNIELTKSRPRIFTPFIRMFWKRCALLATSLLMIRTSTMVAYPILVGKLVSYFTPGQTEVTLNIALLYTAELLLTFVVYIIYIQVYTLFSFEMGFQIKIACCTLMYEKCLRLSPSSMSKYANGLVVTLMSKDVVQFEYAIDFVIAAVAGIFQAVILTNMMYRQIGGAALLGVLGLFLLFPVQGKQ